MAGAPEIYPQTSDTDYAIEFTRSEFDGAAYFVPKFGEHEVPCKRILEGRYYEPHTHRLVEVLSGPYPGDMVHAGTYFGDMLPSFSRKCAGTVYAFEPVLESYVLSRLCVAENALANIWLAHTALGGQTGTVQIDTNTQAGRHLGGMSRIAGQGQPVPMIALDSLGLESLTLMHLDVEGHERQVLEGAVQTIAKCKPNILVEDNNKDCAGFLAECGYASAGNLPAVHVWAPADRAEQVSEHVTNVLDTLKF